MVKEKKEKKKQKKLTRGEKRSVWTFFTLLFPSLLLCLTITFPRSIEISLIAVLLFFYQAVLLKNFIEKYYEDM